MNELQLKMCDIQGRLFELSAERKFSSAYFVKAFMTSDIAFAFFFCYEYVKEAAQVAPQGDSLRRYIFSFACT